MKNCSINSLNKKIMISINLKRYPLLNIYMGCQSLIKVSLQSKILFTWPFPGHHLESGSGDIPDVSRPISLLFLSQKLQSSWMITLIWIWNVTHVSFINFAKVEIWKNQKNNKDAKFLRNLQGNIQKLILWHIHTS